MNSQVQDKEAPKAEVMPEQGLRGQRVLSCQVDKKDHTEGGA